MITPPKNRPKSRDKLKRASNIALYGASLTFIVLIAVGCAPPAGPAQGQEPNTMSFIISTAWFVFCAFAVYWLLVLKPASDKARSHGEFVEGLKKGDAVITSGGIHGRVYLVKSDQITVEVAQNVRLKMDPSHVLPVKKKEVSEDGK